MSSVNTSGTEISTDCQNRNDTTATTSSSDVMEMSPKQLQVITFLSKTEMVLENCLKEEQSSDYKELQNIIKNLAIILKNGEKETKQYVKEALNKDDNKILFLLDKIAFHLFKGMYISGRSQVPTVRMLQVICIISSTLKVCPNLWLAVCFAYLYNSG